MTPELQALVRESWQRFEPAVRGAGAHFYDRLFELDPGTRRLFAATDLSVQEAKLMQMFGDIVRSLDQPAELSPKWPRSAGGTRTTV
jgi:hypothetical protein